jgi:hypothetical protein
MSVKPIRGIVAIAFVLNIVLPVRAEKPKEQLVERVRKAIDRGIQYLRDAEHGTGNWDGVDKASISMPGGWTSLAMLALLNAGVKHDDQIIERGLKYLREIPPSHTYVVALQTMVFAEVGRNEDRERIQNNVNWLIEAMNQQNGRCKGWTYSKSHNDISDNSNTQYALLGLHAGHLAGARIDRKVWESIRDYYIRTQLPDHGWYYNPAFATGTTLTMTTAGLCGLLISGMELNSGREILQDDGTATNCGVYTENKPVVNALGWVSNHFRIDLPYNTFYNLYGIERAGRLSGQRFFGEHDWYREGCQYLVDTQKVDGERGYWQENKSRDSWPIISTSFALLFLSKGRTPILISKLVHGPGEDWNNDHNDARYLVDYASRELFKKQPMAWQIFDARRVQGNSHDDVLALVGDLLQSPIAYFNGHAAPQFQGRDEEMLQKYIEQGGFILAEACCGRKEFDEGFRSLMKKLFPDNPLKKLPAEHPIWRAHADIPPTEFALEGIEYGCKTVVVYSPQDLSCLWEGNGWQTGRGQLAFRLAGNIIAYATGLEPPKPRLSPTDVIKEDQEGAQIPRGYLTAAQLRHEGDWQPAPNAMRNLMDHLRKRAKLDVALQTKPIYANDPDLMDYRFLYMHGRGSFTFSEESVKNLRLDLETGGLLFADACCGKKAFDTAFRELTARLFPGKKLEVIPITDDLYSSELNGTRDPIRSVKCRTEAAGGGQIGEYRDVAPYLEGIKIGGRWAIIYSKYDIGCALENHQSTDCLGHDRESALKLGSAAVLYALKR